MFTFFARQQPTPLQPRPLPLSPDPESNFGLPLPDDPDPFGVRALEQAGLSIKAAGSQEVPPEDEFEFRPNPTSPIWRRSTTSSFGAAQRYSSMSGVTNGSASIHNDIVGQRGGVVRSGNERESMLSILSASTVPTDSGIPIPSQKSAPPFLRSKTTPFPGVSEDDLAFSPPRASTELSLTKSEDNEATPRKQPSTRAMRDAIRANLNLSIRPQPFLGSHSPTGPRSPASTTPSRTEDPELVRAHLSASRAPSPGLGQQSASRSASMVNVGGIPTPPRSPLRLVHSNESRPSSQSEIPTGLGIQVGGVDVASDSKSAVVCEKPDVTTNDEKASATQALESAQSQDIEADLSDEEDARLETISIASSLLTDSEDEEGFDDEDNDYDDEDNAQPTGNAKLNGRDSAASNRQETNNLPRPTHARVLSHSNPNSISTAFNKTHARGPSEASIQSTKSTSSSTGPQKPAVRPTAQTVGSGARIVTIVKPRKPGSEPVEAPVKSGQMMRKPTLPSKNPRRLRKPGSLRGSVSKDDEDLKRESSTEDVPEADEPVADDSRSSLEFLQRPNSKRPVSQMADSKETSKDETKQVEKKDEDMTPKVNGGDKFEPTSPRVSIEQSTKTPPTEGLEQSTDDKRSSEHSGSAEKEISRAVNDNHARDTRDDRSAVADPSSLSGLNDLPTPDLPADEDEKETEADDFVDAEDTSDQLTTVEEPERPLEIFSGDKTNTAATPSISTLASNRRSYESDSIATATTATSTSSPSPLGHDSPAHKAQDVEDSSIPSHAVETETEHGALSMSMSKHDADEARRSPEAVHRPRKEAVQGLSLGNLAKFLHADEDEDDDFY